MPAEIIIPKRRGKAKVKVSVKRAMAESVLEEVKRQFGISASNLSRRFKKSAIVQLGLKGTVLFL